MQLSVSLHSARHSIRNFPKDRPVDTDNWYLVGYTFPENEFEIRNGPKTHSYLNREGEETIEALPPSIIIRNRLTDAEKIGFYITKKEYQQAITICSGMKRACLAPIQLRNAAASFGISPAPV